MYKIRDINKHIIKNNIPDKKLVATGLFFFFIFTILEARNIDKINLTKMIIIVKINGNTNSSEMFRPRIFMTNQSFFWLMKINRLPCNLHDFKKL